MFRFRSMCLLLALVTLLVFLPATSSQFVNFDDLQYVTENPVVQKGLTWSGIEWAFDGIHVSNWHPLTWLSHMADCNLFGLNPGGPHLVNILFHALNASLLFLLMFRLSDKMWASAFVAALFAWHPLHVESVAWVAERKDVLSTFFSLLTLLSYARYVQEKRLCSFWNAVFFFALALLSKPMPVTLPVVMLFLDYWPLKRFLEYQLTLENSTVPSGPSPSSFFKFQFSLFIEKWPFMLLSAISCIITIFSQRQTAMASLAHVPLVLRLENTLTAYVAYLWKMIWPVDLAILYPLHAHIPWQSVAESAILLTGISVLVWRERKCSPWLIIGWLWFLVTLLPVIGLVQVGSQAMADRYSYFPLIGIFLAIAFSMEALTAHFVFLKKWFAATAILILMICVVLTENQLRYWHDSESLFTHALAVESSPAAYNNLGVVFQEKGMISQALNHYIMATLLDPRADVSFGNIGAILAEKGNNALALGYFQRAVDLSPQLPDARENMGITLAKLKRYDEAKHQFSVAMQLDPTSAKPHFTMAKCFLGEGLDAEAVTQLRLALHLEPDNLQMVILLANLLASDEDSKVRNGSEAHALAEKLLKQTGDQQPAALDALAMADAEIGQFDQAVQHQQKAVKLIEMNGPKDDLEVMQKRLFSYQKHQPWRESFKKRDDLKVKPVSN